MKFRLSDFLFCLCVLSKWICFNWFNLLNWLMEHKDFFFLIIMFLLLDHSKLKASIVGFWSSFNPSILVKTIVFFPVYIIIRIFVNERCFVHVFQHFTFFKGMKSWNKNEDSLYWVDIMDDILKSYFYLLHDSTICPYKQALVYFLILHFSLEH